MGCFSWTYANRDTEVANIMDGNYYKMLIPKEYGGGAIKDSYRGYGRIGRVKENNQIELYDMYEVLAFWNAEMPYKDGKVKDYLKYEGDSLPDLKPIDGDTDANRLIGIQIGCYDRDINKLKYPLKLVTRYYEGSYESCQGRSYGDPNQGWYPLSWDEFEPDE